MVMDVAYDEPAEHVLGGLFPLYAGPLSRQRFYHCAPERITSVYNLLDSCWKQLSKNRLAIRRVGTYFLSGSFNNPSRTNTLEQNCWPGPSASVSSSFSSSSSYSYSSSSSSS